MSQKGNRRSTKTLASPQLKTQLCTTTTTSTAKFPAETVMLLCCPHSNPKNYLDFPRFPRFQASGASQPRAYRCR